MKSRVMMMAVFFFIAAGLVFSGCSKNEEAASEKPAKAEQKAMARPAPEQGEEGSAGEAPAEKNESEATAGGEEVKSYKYVIETDMTGQDKSRMEYMVAPGKMNLKFSQQEGNEWKMMSHMIMNGKDMYIIPPMGKTAMKMEASEEQMENTVPKDMLFIPDWNQFSKNYDAEGFVNKGSETVNGVKCTKYEAKLLTALETIYVDGKGLIRRIEIPGEQGQPARTMDVVEVQLNPKFTDADFLPPKGYTIQALPKMPGMPGMPAMPRGRGSR